MFIAKPIPGRDARVACKSSISAARSVTAARAFSFWRTQVRPPSLASTGRLFLPPTYFCTRAIFELGT